MKIWTTHSSLLSILPAGIDPSTIQSNPNLSDASGISCMAPEIDRIDNIQYRKVASSRLSRLVAHLRIFRLFIKGKFDPYVL